MASRGLRVLGVARGAWQGERWPASQHDFEFRFLGLVGFVDPPRPEVPAAIAECRSAGVRIIMMTGDHPATARAIAREVGLSERAEVLTGAQIDALDDDALRAAPAPGGPVRATAAGAEAAPGAAAAAGRRSGGDDRRRGQRRTGAEGRRHRHRHGRARHRRGARGRGAGAAGRQLRQHRGGDPAGPAHLRQHHQGHPLHLRRAHAGDRAGAAAGAAALADAADPGAHRAAGTADRSGLLGGVRGRAGSRRHHAASRRERPAPRRSTTATCATRSCRVWGWRRSCCSGRRRCCGSGCRRRRRAPRCSWHWCWGSTC